MPKLGPTWRPTKPPRSCCALEFSKTPGCFIKLKCCNDKVCNLGQPPIDHGHRVRPCAQYAAGAILRAERRSNPPSLMGNVATLLATSCCWASPVKPSNIVLLHVLWVRHCSKEMVTSWPGALDQQLPCALQIRHPWNLAPEISFHSQSLLTGFLDVPQCSYWGTQHLQPFRRPHLWTLSHSLRRACLPCVQPNSSSGLQLICQQIVDFSSAFRQRQESSRNAKSNSPGRSSARTSAKALWAEQECPVGESASLFINGYKTVDRTLQKNKLPTCT